MNDEINSEVDAVEEVQDTQASTSDATPTKSAPEKHVYPRLKKKYQDEIAPSLKEKFGLKNVFEIPNLTKIVVNMGIGDAAKDSKIVGLAKKDLAKITGQEPKTSKAKNSIAQFKLREGQIIGVSSTIRGYRMWEFLDRVLSLAIPRIRDFRGLSPKQFDGHGNYTFGLQEQSVFHEITPDELDGIRGMDITLVTTAKNDSEGLELLTQLGFPFKK